MVFRCTRCLYTDAIPNITFDEKGVCNYCHLHDQLDREYPTGIEGERILTRIADDIRRNGKGKPYDVIVGVSGGCDSSYMLYLAKKKLGLRPVAVHFDNTWDSTIAVENIQRVLRNLDVDLFTYVVDNKEYDDIYRSFLQAGVIDLDAATDIALTTTMYEAAEKYDVRYIFEGHSFRTEGIAPLGWIYMDGKYINSVHHQYGQIPFKTYPNLWFWKFMKWTAWKNIQRIRPLYYIDYRKKDAMDLLTRELGWKWYGGHHLENRFTAFTHTYFFPRRYQTDTRILGYAALVRSGQMTRDQGLEILEQPQALDAALVEMVIKRLGFTSEEFEQLMDLPKKTYRDYRTYKGLFERLRPLFYVMYRLKRVPKSFYLKFTRPDPLMQKTLSGTMRRPS